MSEYISQAARGTSLLVGQSAVSGIFRIANIMILTRLLLQTEMGQIALLAVIFGFTQFLAALGLNHAAPLVVPQEEDAGRLDRVRGFLFRGVILVVVSSVVLMLLFVMISPSILNTGMLSEDMLRVATIIIPFSALEVFLDSFLLARYSVKRLAIGRITFDLTRMAATVGLVLYGFGVLGVAYGWLAGEVVALFLFGAASIRGLPKRSSSIDLRPVLAFAVPSLLFQTIDVTIQNTDRIILLSLTDLGSLGVYDVILGILFMMSFISLTVSVSLYPVLTRFRLRIAQDKHLEKEIGSVLSALARYILILLLPISIMVSLYPYKVLDVLFGGSYASYPNAAVSFSILILSYSVWGLTYALHTSLRSMSEAKFFLISGICVILFEIVGCWYLTSLLGLLGSALIRALYIIILFLSAWARLKQRGVNWLGSIVPSIIRITLAALLAGLLIFWLAPQDTVGVILLFAISGLVYILLLFAFREINELDFLLAIAVLPESLHDVITRIHQIYNKWKRIDVSEQQESVFNHM